MSKDSSGLFSGTSGARSSSSTRSNKVIKQYSKERVKEWAHKEKERLTGKQKKTFNTACVVYDEITGKYYYGRNGGFRDPGYVRNPILFGDGKHRGILPKESLNGYAIGNCAEVDAINQALNAGSRLGNLHITTIHTTKTDFGKNKPACENCTYSFKGKVKQNYSGWKGDKNGK